MVILLHIAKMLKIIEEGTPRAAEISMYKGSSSRPRSFSTYIMGAGILLVFIGIFFLQFLLFIPGALLVVVGLIAAFIEAIFEK